MKTFRSFVLAALVAASAFASAPSFARTASNGVNFNGIGFNGVNFNGINFNGIGFNGIGFNGIGFNGLNQTGSDRSVHQQLSQLALQPLM